LIDWGTRSARKDKERECLRRFGKLIEEYQPELVVVENCAAKGSRRCARIRELIDAMAKAATSRTIRVRRITRQEVKRDIGGTCKHEVVQSRREAFPRASADSPTAASGLGKRGPFNGGV
jgi:Holliday junction resolvasome RuvABC endonuclease subunit